MKVLFFGTPAIAVPFLEQLTRSHSVVGVVCRPDEPVGRGQEVTAPATKVFAQAHNIPVFQPSGPWTDEVSGALKKCGADIGIVVAYGRIMPRPVFSIPRLGCVNIHFSLLPKYRGAAPMQWAIINGERETGVSAFWLEEGLDSGPLFHQKSMPIAPDDDAASLRVKLVELGLQVSESVMEDASKDQLIHEPQTGTPSLAPLLKKEMGTIDWHAPAQKIVNLARGLCEWPVAQTNYLDQKSGPKKLKILKARVGENNGSRAPGFIVDAGADRGIVVQSGQGQVCVLDVKPEGKKAMAAWAFWQGAGLKLGDKFE